MVWFLQIGFCIYMNSALITQSSKKQSRIDMSIFGADSVAITMEVGMRNSLQTTNDESQIVQAIIHIWR